MSPIIPEKNAAFSARSAYATPVLFATSGSAALLTLCAPSLREGAAFVLGDHGPGAFWVIPGLSLLGAAAMPALPEGLRFLLATVALGLIAGAAVCFFDIAMATVAVLAQSGAGSFAPIVGALVSSALCRAAPAASTDAVSVGHRLRGDESGSPRARSPSSTRTPSPTSKEDGLQWQAHAITTFLRATSAVFALGCGVSLGPTAPRVEIGANLALIAHALLGDVAFVGEMSHGFWVAGIASAMASGARAPLTATLFALEVGYFSVPGQPPPGRLVLSGIILAPVLAVAVATHTWDGMLVAPALHVSKGMPLGEASGPVLYCSLAIFGCVCGLVGIGFKFMQGVVERCFHFVDSRGLPAWTHPMLAGCAVSLVSRCGAPEILFSGWGDFKRLLGEPESWSSTRLLLLVGLKPLLTSLCAKSGLVGGLFAPSLFTGATLGTLVAAVAPPSLGLGSATLATAGMAGCLGSMVGVPLAAMAMPFELTQEYAFLPAAMVTVACGQAVQCCLVKPSAPEIGAGSWQARARWQRARKSLRALRALSGSLGSLPSTSARHASPSGREVAAGCTLEGV